MMLQVYITLRRTERLCLLTLGVRVSCMYASSELLALRAPPPATAAVTVARAAEESDVNYRLLKYAMGHYCCGV
jgi:hypothetical protein